MNAQSRFICSILIRQSILGIHKAKSRLGIPTGKTLIVLLN